MSARRASVGEVVRRQNIAFGGPAGTWAQRWLPWVCKHLVVRCTHGDERLHRGRARACMVCGRCLPGALPAVCYFTDRLHDTGRP